MKIMDSFDQAVADIGDGVSLMVFCWDLVGTPCNLIRALYKKGVKNLTVISHNFVPAWIGPNVITQEEYTTPYIMADRIKKLITAWPSPAIAGLQSSPLAEKLKTGEIEIEITSHGTLAKRIQAGGSGIGGFYTEAGVGTVLEKGKEKKVIDGREYILETPLQADFGFVKAYKADKYGNLVYNGSERGCNPLIAMASKTTIAEVEEIVEVGELDPNQIVTPGIFVDRIVKIPAGGMGTVSYVDELLKKYLRRK